MKVLVLLLNQKMSICLIFSQKLSVLVKLQSGGLLFLERALWAKQKKASTVK